MKEQTSKTSRRKFLSKAGVVALSVAAAKGSTNDGNAKPEKVKVSKRRRGNERSRKLPPVEDHPEDDSGFTLKRRMPGWRPDSIAEDAPEGAEPDPAKDEHLFLEEALRQDENTHYWEALPVPFNDPNLGDKWILGHPFDEEKAATDFDKLLATIAKRARRYNAALYWMRRLHFHRFAPKGSSPPPHNCDGDQANRIPNWETESEAFKKLVAEAECEWICCVRELNEVLDGNASEHSKFKSIWADMIEVNGYIASMRIVADERPMTKVFKNGKYRILEVPGSSSSHVSISSAFSSPSR